MTIQLACPKCRTEFSFAEELRGQTVRCKTCRTIFVVDGPGGKSREAPTAGFEQRVQDKPPRVVARRIDADQPPPARPVKRREERPRSNAPMLLLTLGGLAVLVLLILVGGGLAAYFMMRSPSKGPGVETVANVSTGEGGGMAGVDSPPLRYRWKGSPHVYHLKVEVDKADYTEVHEGNCSVHANPRRNQAADVGERQGNGTGFVVNSNGWVVTCAHVVRDATKIDVTVGGKTYPAQVVALNNSADVALIRIAAQGLPTLALADSDAADLGQDVWALGFPLSDVLGSNLKVTRGTLSGINTRGTRRVLQVDASINPGNSGGPLVVETGMVLGVTSAKLAGGAVTNVGFCTPANEVKSLLKSKNVSYTTDGWNTKLDGPTLVKRVSAATAYVFVTVGAPSDPEGCVLTGQGDLTETQRPKPGAGMIPGMPRFPKIWHSRLEIDGVGQIIQANGGTQLPCMLGEVTQFLVDPLPEDDRLSWSASSVWMIEEGGEGGIGGRPFGPGMMPGGPGGPFGRPDNRGGGKTRQGKDHATYTRVGAAGDTVRIQKKYELKVPPTPQARSSLTLVGTGETVFDVKQGMPKSIDFSGTLTVTAGNSTEKLPVTVTCRLLDRAEQKPATPPDQQKLPAAANNGPKPDAPAEKPRKQAPPAQPERAQPIVGPAPPALRPDADVALGEPAGAVAVGGAGQLLFITLPTKKQIAVFDLKAGQIVRTLPLADKNAKIATGRDRLVVYLPGAEKFEHFNLTTFERSAAVDNPIGAEVKLMTMGSASSGPLVLHAPAPQNKSTQGVVLLDPVTFKQWPETLEPINDMPFGLKTHGDGPLLTVSADGRLIVLRSVFDFVPLTLENGTYRPHKFHADPRTWALPSADGQLLIGNGQAFTAAGEPMGGHRGGHQHAVWCVPALQGGLTLSLNEAYEAAVGQNPYLKAQLHDGASAEPLATFPRKMDTLSQLVDWFFRKPQPFDRHVFFAPGIGALALLSAKNDRIEWHRFDLNVLLTEAKDDYLLVLTQPADVVQKGATFTYVPFVKSKAKGLTYTLDKPPAGMTVAADGTVTWPVPADFAQPAVETALVIRDVTGRELRQPFRVRVAAK
ncbi:MAG: trypsin-like peptidase domain-containing protein [Gemmataceae bacterium]